MIGIVCGLKSEAACAPQAPDFSLGVTGASAERAAEIARRLAAEGAEGLISFGVSGALAPDLQPGSLLLAAEIRDARGPVAFDAALTEKLAARLTSGGCEASRKIVYGSNILVSSVEAKRRLYLETGADAVDMESHAVARIAAERALPFAALRAIADAADCVLPVAAQQAVGPDGGTRLFSVLAGIARRPSELGALIRLGRDSQTAHAALRRASGAIRQLTMA